MIKFKRIKKIDILNLSKMLPMTWLLYSIKKHKIKADGLLTLFEVDDKNCLWNDCHPNRLIKIAYQKKLISLIDGYFVINSTGELLIKKVKTQLPFLLEKFNEV